MRRRFTGSLIVILALVTLAAACGDDDDSTAAGTTTTTASSDDGGTSSTVAPEDLRAPADEVAKGLTNIDGISRAVADAVKEGDDEAAGKLLGRIEPIWEDVEGTVKANDEDAYLTFEDSFAALGLAVDDSDADKADDAANDISAAVSEYLKAYPG